MKPEGCLVLVAFIVAFMLLGMAAGVALVNRAWYTHDYSPYKHQTTVRR